MIGTCAICGATWYMDKSTGEHRLRHSKSGKLFCSHKCTSVHIKQCQEIRRLEQKTPKPRDET